MNRTLAGDVLNLTIAVAADNCVKSSNDAYDTTPNQNKCWFANRVVQVKREYGMTVEADEADALEEILRDCDSIEMVEPACND